MREKFVPLMKCLSLLLCSLGACCKADPCGLLLYSRRQELAGLASHWVCVMHSFCPAPYCWAAEAGDITLDDKAIPKWLQVELNGEMGWGCRGACHLDQHCDFVCLLKKKSSVEIGMITHLNLKYFIGRIYCSIAAWPSSRSIHLFLWQPADLSFLSQGASSGHFKSWWELHGESRCGLLGQVIWCPVILVENFSCQGWGLQKPLLLPPLALITQCYSSLLKPHLNHSLVQEPSLSTSVMGKSLCYLCFPSHHSCQAKRATAGSCPQNCVPRPSLVVQWLRLCAGGAGSIPGWRTKIPQAVWCGILNKHTQKTPVSPDLEGAVRCFIVMIQRGCHQLMDILLTGWWWGKWESASSILSVQPVWGLYACGQDTVNFSHLMEVSVSVKQLVYSLRGNQDPAPRLQYCLFWLFLPCLCIFSLP